ncbi:DUF2163 domain-containing protein [Mesorhizobium sp. LHD-90]|uniref:DUF2163 domain-containing protein n=1 Tax=Mesorhizobium sp. LHD-90 TaxID=3071414 RepID=UPI0027E12092|nr:DUF2163 domain-containing protein [Mesorhizobium sp. LHD-90]MDQ6436891.1 DUF2163 domain-containing protein [Mesorhizobium sp. LHD-90]
MTIYPEALAAHLAGTATTVCHCWRLTRRDGTVKGFTDHDNALTVDGTTFRPLTGFSATEARDTMGLAVDTVDVEGALSSDEIDEADIARGFYDDATVETFLVNWRAPGEFARLRRATIGKITRRDGAFVAELKSRMHALDQVNGRVIARRCDAELGDARCRFVLDQPGFSATGTVLAIEAPDLLRVSGLEGFAAGWFSFGLVEWTSGARAGAKSHVIGHLKAAGGVSLSLQPEEGPSPETGDAFLVRAGCDKAFSTCREKFGNAVNFQGFPHLPGNDAAYGYAVDGDVFDGGPLVP